jgi:outer membrane protein OmpA-like peptidoglycan-associated protein
MKLTPMGKIIALILVVGAAAGTWRYWNRIAPTAASKDAVVPTKIDLPAASTGNSNPAISNPANASFNAAGDEPGCTNKPEVRLLGYAWNAQMGMLLATGGAQATKGSLMCQNGVNFKWSRQDDNSKLQEALVSFATDLSKGNRNPTRGAHFVTIMGDGGAAFIKGLNDSLKRIGPEYQAKIVDAIGYSRGEDKFMGPQAWADNPAASRGGVVTGVLRDGDWNIAQKWLGDNGLKTNPDEKTYDPDALNWIAANDYVDAAEKYIAGYTESRPVVRDGKRTGETKTLKVDGVVTWTPADVSIAKKKGGLVSIISTREYSSQMPCVVIGIDKWCKSNRGTVESMIRAIAAGSQQIQNNPAALRRGAEISAKLYKEAGADAAYWEKYFKGTTEVDATGLRVELGGSSVNNLADSLLAFGLVPGSANLVATTYTVFGNLVQQQYPELVPNFYPASQVVDGSYLANIQRTLTSPQRILVAKAAKPVFKRRPTTAGAPRPRVLSRRSWNIQFNAGKATFTPATRNLLDQLSRDLLIAGGTSVEVHGHTDNLGNPATSMPLSEARAFAVKNWLERRSSVNFPQGRVRVFAHGETQPLVPNNSPQNRNKNRRVEIILRAA